MSYDSMYSDLSTRGTSNQILTLVLEARDQVLLAEDNVEVLEAQAVSSAAAANGSAESASLSSASAVTSASTATAAQSASAISAAAAAQSAIDAETNSEAALIVANAAAADASEALTTANGIAGTANAALAASESAEFNSEIALIQASNAITIAEGAVTTADGIAGTANTALTNSNTAISTANSAVSTANSAVSTADSALAAAEAAQDDADALATSKQDLNTNLTALSGLTGAADFLAYFTGVGALALASLTSFGRSLISSASAETARTTLGVSDGWATQPIGVPIPIFSNLTGTASPPTGQGYTYIKLTATDAYNTGLLGSESISGSSPLVIATAVITVTGSPINGQTVSLINSERRFLRAGSAGVSEQDALQSHTHDMAIQSSDNTAGFSAFRTVANIQQTGATGAVTSGGRTATETRSKNIGVTYFMRVL